jgi:hypothetical protein
MVTLSYQNFLQRQINIKKSDLGAPHRHLIIYIKRLLFGYILLQYTVFLQKKVDTCLSSKNCSGEGQKVFFFYFDQNNTLKMKALSAFVHYKAQAEAL